MTTRRRFQIILSRRGNRWLAHVAGEPELAATGHNTRAARRLITAALQQRYGQADFSVDLVLPSDIDEALRKHQADERLLRALAKSVPKSRLRCIEQLLALNLSQAEVAELLGMSRGHLAVSLKRGEDDRATSVASPRRSLAAKR